jgi:alginate O-acetyltransferase complex protein AlgI
MLFSSLTFIFLFLPLTLLVYYVFPKAWRNVFLLFASLLFFAWGGISNTFLFITSLLINFFCARQINRQPGKNTWLIIGIIFNLTLLIAFKYLSFLLENLSALYTQILPGEPFWKNYAEITLPLGISFYTFHQISMLVDLHRRKEKVAINFWQSALYVSFFPQLIAGPIIRYKDIIEQIKQRKETLTLFSSGIERFIIGLAKKVLIANTMAELADNIFACQTGELTVAAAWLGAFAYTLQIYFDFSGYSDMAIGLGRMFGFQIMENFNLPYVAKSIKEFWHRWHISLSTWFRDYLYIPLGGNQISENRTYINLVIVFLLTGLWHGASWSFVFWGLFHGTFLILERIGLSKLLEKFPHFIGWSYTMFIVIIGWVFFRIEDFTHALAFLQKMFGIGVSGYLEASYFLDNENILLFSIGALISTRFLLHEKSTLWNGIVSFVQQNFLIKQLVLLMIFMYSVIVLNASSYNPFIYFNF